MGGQKDNFVFLGVLPHMIHFWNPWDQRSTQEVFQEVFDTIKVIRKVENDQKLGFWIIISILIGIVFIVAYNMWRAGGPSGPYSSEGPTVQILKEE